MNAPRIFLGLIVLFIAACGHQQDTQAAGAGPITGSDSELSIRQLQPGVWMHTSFHTLDSGIRYPANGLIVREGDELLMIDPAWGAEATMELLARIKKEIGLPVTRAIATHFHSDRTGGVDVLAKAGIEVFAHPATQKLSAQAGNPVPENAFAGLAEPGTHVMLGSAEVFYPGAGHAQDNIMVWLPAQKILYGGCAIRELATDSLGNTADADLASWPQAIQRAQRRYDSALIVIPGHGAVGSPALLQHMAELFHAQMDGL